MFSAQILVVDDEHFVRQFVNRVLVELGHHVVQADSAEKALDVFQEQVFDLVFADVKMTGIDGIEMVSRMRKMDATVVPVVMTALRDQETAVRALECGVQNFLIKPFSLEELKDRLDHALGERLRIVENRMLIGDLMQTRSNLQRQVLEQDEKLTYTERYLHHLIDAAPFGILSTDQEGFILTFNGVAEAMYGFERSEVLGRSVSQLFGVPIAMIEEGYLSHMRKDGTSFPIILHVRNIMDENGEAIANLYILEDMSERELLESQLFRAERLSLLGQMAPRIAHEFKTPLQLISGNAELAYTWLEKGNIEQAMASINRVAPASQQLVYMVQQMTNLGKPEEAHIDSVYLDSEIDKLLETLQPLGIVKYCQIERHFDVDIPCVMGDPVQIEQVLQNLIINAIQAMESSLKKELTIGVHNLDNRAVQVVIQDSGHGIPKSKILDIFQPFYTTKPEGKGTGLGLAIVKSILKRHHASIDVSSKEGEGTTFTIVFPVTQRLPQNHVDMRFA